MKVSKRLLPFAVLLCALLWGSAFPGIKGIYADWAANGIDATFAHRMLIAGIRFAVAGCVLLLTAKRPLKDWQQTPKRSLLGFVLLQTSVQYLLFYTALAVSSATLGSILTATGSLWWVMLTDFAVRSCPSFRADAFVRVDVVDAVTVDARVRRAFVNFDLTQCSGVSRLARTHESIHLINTLSVHARIRSALVNIW